MKWIADSPEQTIAVGREIAARIQVPQLVLLIGDLGAGKTTLSKGILSALGVAAEDDVASPTFSLIHEYPGPPKTYHIDLYRLDRVPEFETLGLDDLWEQEAVVLIEWGEKFTDQLPTKHVEIRLRYLEDDRRQIEWVEATQAEPS